MKKYLLFISVLAFFYNLSSAQNYIITDEEGHNVTNLEIDTFSHPDSSLVAMHFNVKNNTAGSVRVKVKKTEISTLSGSSNYFCWATQCYLPSVYVSPDFLNMPAGYSTTNIENLSVDYLPSGKIGTSKIAYTIFNSGNPDDSVQVIVNYNITLGIDNLSRNEVVFSKPYPNPAKDKFSIDYNLIGNANAKIIIHDILGSEITSKEIVEKRGTIQLITTGLSNGIYFYSIIINNKTVRTNKLIISR